MKPTWNLWSDETLCVALTSMQHSICSHDNHQILAICVKWVSRKKNVNVNDVKHSFLVRRKLCAVSYYWMEYITYVKPCSQPQLNSTWEGLERRHCNRSFLSNWSEWLCGSICNLLISVTVIWYIDVQALFELRTNTTKYVVFTQCYLSAWLSSSVESIEKFSFVLSSLTMNIITTENNVKLEYFQLQ